MGEAPSFIEGKTALVTGAAKRVGRSVALALAAGGASVVVHYRSSADEAEAVADEIRALGVEAWPIAADLADPAQAEELYGAACEDAAGPVDILVNNASIFPPGELSAFTPEQLVECMQVNAMAPLVLARALAASSAGGAVVNLLDSRITAADPAHAAYLMSKRALLTLTRMMALEFAPHHRVNAVAPGPVLAPEGESGSYLRKRGNAVPLGRPGAPEDVAAAAVYLLDAEYVTGQVIFVDGGAHMEGSTYGV